MKYMQNWQVKVISKKINHRKIQIILMFKLKAGFPQYSFNRGGRPQSHVHFLFWSSVH